MWPSFTPAVIALSTLTLLTAACGGGGEGTGGGDPTTGGGGQGAGGGGEGGVGAAGGAGGAGGGSTGGGGMGGMIEVGPDATIESLGDADKVLLKGWLLTPSESFAGEVLIVGDTIVCADVDCSTEPQAQTASVVQTNGIILPGMIDTHNHINFNIFDGDDWSPDAVYDNHDDWGPQIPRYNAMLDAKQYMSGEIWMTGMDSPIDLSCELVKYGEVKGLVAGTTAIAGGGRPANKVCYRTLIRTIDQSANALCFDGTPTSCPDPVQVATLFPSDGDSICSNFTAGTTEAFLVHIGEGTDQAARDELADLAAAGTAECLLAPQTTIVHGTAFQDAEFDILAQHGMSLSWSPRSNVFLYGGGTDLSATTDIPLALSKGIRVALSPDWSIGGSVNLLEELKFADLVDNSEWGDSLTPQMLVEMVTKNAAEVLSFGDQIGQLAPGFKADVTVIGGDPNLPYASVVAATPNHVRMVFVGGKLLYGDDQLEALAPANPGCEALDICGRNKFVCVAAPGGTTSNL
ncbi:MAG: amidohydrolase family protein, partial [Myxococcales bacterium]|nr:amidohydrolase family protein [Myxococcales bacterium]